jgi:hypothetical protein
MLRLRRVLMLSIYVLLFLLVPFLITTGGALGLWLSTREGAE